MTKFVRNIGYIEPIEKTKTKDGKPMSFMWHVNLTKSTYMACDTQEHAEILSILARISHKIGLDLDSPVAERVNKK